MTQKSTPEVLTRAAATRRVNHEIAVSRDYKRRLLVHRGRLLVEESRLTDDKLTWTPISDVDAIEEINRNFAWRPSHLAVEAIGHLAVSRWSEEFTSAMNLAEAVARCIVREEVHRALRLKNQLEDGSARNPEAARDYLREHPHTVRVIA